MKQEDKDLLLKDLCARVPYHPKGHVINACNGAKCDEWLTCATFTMFTNVTNNCRLYLRPMSSMTEEEKEELSHLLPKDWSVEIDKLNNFYFDMSPSIFMEIDIFLNIIDWLIAHHFDYRMTDDGRTMIEAGLALPAPEGMYDLK